MSQFKDGHRNTLSQKREGGKEKKKCPERFGIRILA